MEELLQHLEMSKKMDTMGSTTLPKTTIAPARRPSPKEPHLPTPSVSGQGGYLKTDIFQQQYQIPKLEKHYLFGDVSCESPRIWSCPSHLGVFSKIRLTPQWMSVAFLPDLNKLEWANVTLWSCHSIENLEVLDLHRSQYWFNTDIHHFYSLILF